MSALSCRALSVTLSGRAVLADVSLDLEPGQATAIVGANGAGKSTLLSCLSGLRRPGRGEVRLGGMLLTALQPRERARRIGLIAQTPEIAWALEVSALVGLGRIPHLGARGLSLEDGQAVQRALAAAGASDLAGRIVTTLSGGERARALIARALAGEPDWLLADEPLTGLDPGHQLDAAALFRALAAEGKGVVVTLHDLSLAARMADRIVVLGDGRILADGPPRDALTPDVLRAAYGVEARLIEGAGGLIVEAVGRAG